LLIFFWRIVFTVLFSLRFCSINLWFYFKSVFNSQVLFWFCWTNLWFYSKVLIEHGFILLCCESMKKKIKQF
jgi:hypothetical protein